MKEVAVKPRGRDSRPVRDETNPALGDLGELSEKVVPLLERANGATWYEDERNAVDIAILALCRVRRAGAGARGTAAGGDSAVREMLEQSDPDSVLWIASRAISYMDEHGFPETLLAYQDER